MCRHVTNFVDENWEVEAIMRILIRQPHFTRIATSIVTDGKSLNKAEKGVEKHAGESKT